ncbi:MAG: endo-1,4-beta-xylanase [Bacteroidetes bacterium]|nr:endo-1,4-beta-xylanase [Bacteroidota bacterium]
MQKLFLFALLLFAFSFKPGEPPCEEIRLRDKALFPVGAAVNTDKLKNEENYWKIVPVQFNSLTPERIMKPAYLHPQKDKYNFFETDHLMDFCKQFKIRLHGHTLIWHKSLPEWMETFKGNKTEWEALMKEHIQTIIHHCKGTIKSWDVVNEAFNDDGTLRKNIWLKNIGESYIEKAFLYASEADSTAKFFYNDYSLEKHGEKFGAVIAFLKGLKAKGIKVDGVGMQMHVALDYPVITDIDAAAMHLQEEGFLVHYSEVDISIRAGQSIFAKRSNLLALQKQRIKAITSGFMKLKQAYRFGITFWGVSDNDSWLTEESLRAMPLLYDASYKIKPMYCGFVEALEN